MNNTTSAKFCSPNSVFDFSFLYPKDWYVKEFQTETDSALAIMRQMKDETRPNPSISIFVRPSSYARDAGLDVEELIKKYLDIQRKRSGFRLISRKRRSVAGTEAEEIETSFRAIFPIYPFEGQETPFAENAFFVRKSDTFYEIRYLTHQEDYLQYLPVLESLLRSFEFRPRTCSLT